MLYEIQNKLLTKIGGTTNKLGMYYVLILTYHNNMKKLIGFAN